MERSRGLDVRDLARPPQYIDRHSIACAVRPCRRSAESARVRLEAAAKLDTRAEPVRTQPAQGYTHAIAFLLQPHPAIINGEPFFVPFMKGFQAGFAARNSSLSWSSISPAAIRGGSAGSSRRAGRTQSSCLDAAHRPDASSTPRSALPFRYPWQEPLGGHRYPSLDLNFVGTGEKAAPASPTWPHTGLPDQPVGPDLNFAISVPPGLSQGVRRATGSPSTRNSLPLAK